MSRKRALFLLWFYPVWCTLAVLAWAGFALDEILFPAYRKQAVEKPLFIVSNFRSGSTFTQRTLARDTDNFCSMKSGDLYFMPSITQQRIFGLLARVNALFGHKGEKALRRLDTLSLGKVILHPVSIFDPEEDDNILFLIWSTFYMAFPFPYLEEIPPYQYFDTEIPHSDRRRIMAFYRTCIRRYLYATGGRHYIAKNPVFSAKIESLLEFFPDARILYLVRNPLDMLPSTVSVFSYAWGLFSDPPEKYPHCNEILAWTKYWYDHPLAVIDRDASQRCMVVNYDDLVRSPDSVFRVMYRRFGYAESDALETILREAAEAARVYTSTHEYNLQSMGFTREQIVQEFAHIFARFGFDDRSLPASEDRPESISSNPVNSNS